ncbi:MAG TPA: type I phosphomannose isomerase catalytic subunit [Planctomycetota bacterium]|nr:type I phosphomannose isomerase catalytic subunit [Planctomycetota bacterium]
MARAVRKSVDARSSAETGEAVEPRHAPGFDARALFFEPRLEVRVWGGRKLESFAKSLPEDLPIGESWEVSDVPGKPSKVARGSHSGTTLRRLMELHAGELLGRKGAPAGSFPLLLKLLDARQNLSVQVHPSDEDLLRQGLPPEGKTEAWIILEAEPGARIVHGLAPGVTRSALLESLREAAGGALSGEEEAALFRWVPVTAGDIVFVPAGTVHAVGGGIVLLEVQQTSDITYRLYDWGRPGTDGKPRALHIDEAARVLNEEALRCPWSKTASFGTAGRGFETLLDCDRFRVDLLVLDPARGARTASASASTRERGEGEFHILAGLEGTARYAAASGDSAEIARGLFALLPAALGDYTLEALAGPAKVLRFLGT